MKKNLAYLWIATVLPLAINTAVVFLRNYIYEFNDGVHFLIVVLFIFATVLSIRVIGNNDTQDDKVFEALPIEDAILNVPFRFEITGMLSEKEKILTCYYPSDNSNPHTYFVETDEEIGRRGTGIIEEEYIAGIGRTFKFTVREHSAHSTLLNPASA